MGIDMGADAFAPWHIILLVVVLVLLFGARRLPGAAKSLGESMHIFKQSVQGVSPDDASKGDFSATSTLPPPPPAAPAVAPPAADPQQQIEELQRQVQELQRQTASGNGSLPETQTSQPL